MKMAVIYYSHQPAGMPAPLVSAVLNRLDAAMARAQDAGAEVEPIAVTPRGVGRPGWGEVVTPVLHRGHQDQYERMLAGLQATTAPIAYLVEHDVLYPEDYFLTPDAQPGRWTYALNVWRCTKLGAWPYPRPITSCVHGCTEDLIHYAKTKLDMIAHGERIVWDEPGYHREGGTRHLQPRSQSYPVLDVRWGGNLTGERHNDVYATTIPGWGPHAPLWVALGLG